MLSHQKKINSFHDILCEEKKRVHICIKPSTVKVMRPSLAQESIQKKNWYA